MAGTPIPFPTLRGAMRVEISLGRGARCEVQGPAGFFFKLCRGNLPKRRPASKPKLVAGRCLSAQRARRSLALGIAQNV
jgi:hypothetical protein